MPVHDWTRVDAGIFHDFHHAWIEEIKRVLNRGLLPRDYYALAEQIAGVFSPLTGTPPGVLHHAKAELDLYAAKADAVAVRHTSDHRVIAVEIVSPGKKSSKRGVHDFVEKAERMLRAGIHLLIIDLFPPTSRDPSGMHKAFWDPFLDSEFAPPAGRPLTLAAYSAGTTPEAFVEPTAVGLPLQEMPLFLAHGEYVPAPLEATYQSAWDAVPEFWRGVLSADTVHE